MDIPVCLTKVATWACEVSGHGVLIAMQRRAESRHIPHAPSEAQNASKNCSVCQKKRQSTDDYVADSLVGKP